MSPRHVGVALLVGSIAAGVLAGVGISVPILAIPAALLLAAASVGAAAGILLLFRRTWEDHSWPPGGSPEAATPQRAARRLGIFLLALVPLGAAVGGWVVVEEGWSVDLVLPALYMVGLLVIGSMLMSIGRPGQTPRSVSDDVTDPDEDLVVTDGWRRLTRVDWQLSFFLSVPLLVGLVILAPWRVADAFVDEPLAELVLTTLLVVLTVGGTMIVLRRRHPDVWVDVSGRRVKVGRRLAHWDTFTTAELGVFEVWPGAPRTLILTLRTPDGLRAPLVVRRRGRLGLSPWARDAAVALVESSEVAMPRAKEDPTGRFARFNFPSNLTKEDALALIERPPQDGEPLPIPLA
jgi:hypothetical protein